MFERYTEKARRVIFFARYEASQFGSPYIETEHLLLGLLHEDKELARRFIGSAQAAEAIRNEVERHTTFREKTDTSVDLPLSNEGKRVLSYGANEAEQLNHKHIGPEHLLLGLLREEKCFAAQLLHDRGLRLDSIREQLRPRPHELSESRLRGEQPAPQLGRDFAQASGQVRELVGRKDELGRLIAVLCRHSRANPVLVGEPGVGKRTIVAGLVERIADGSVPDVLAQKSVLVLNPPPIADPTRTSAWLKELAAASQEDSTILFVDDLNVPTDDVRSLLHSESILKPFLMGGKIRCISTATPTGYAKSIENHGWLERCFQVIQIAPASEEEAARVLLAINMNSRVFMVSLTPKMRSATRCAAPIAASGAELFRERR